MSTFHPVTLLRCVWSPCVLSECQQACREALSGWSRARAACWLGPGLLVQVPGVAVFLDMHPRARPVASLCLGFLCSWDVGADGSSGLEVRVRGGREGACVLPSGSEKQGCQERVPHPCLVGAADTLASKQGEWGAVYARSLTFLYSERFISLFKVKWVKIMTPLERRYNLGSTDFFFSLPNVLARFFALKYTFKFWLGFNIYFIYNSYVIHIYNIL